MPRPTVHVGPEPESNEAAPRVAANGVVMATDTRGRTIGVKKMNALQRMRLFKLIGADGATNPQYVGYAILAASAVSLNGAAMGAGDVGSLIELEHRVQILDDDGLDAIGKVLRSQEPDQAPDAQGDIGDAAKN